MLLELHVRNLAVAKEIEIQFSPGFNVLTGETGAGKSIIIDAIALLTGGRGQAEIVREGAESTLVEGLFDIRNCPAVQAELEELGLLDGDELLISREVTAAGRSRCRVNGRLATVATLQRLGRHLVAVHGQHAHQSLLAAENHIAWLDAFAGAEAQALAAEVEALWRRWRALRQRLADWEEQSRERERRRDLLRFQIDEIDAARLVPGEDLELRRERDRLANAARIVEHVARAYALIEQGDGAAGGLLDGLGEALHHLATARQWDETLAEALQWVEGAASHLEEAARLLRQHVERVAVDPGRLAEVEERLDLIHRLGRKYGAGVEAILAYRDACARELEEEESAHAALEDVEAECAAVAGRLAEQAERLSALRRAAADRLARRMEAELRELAMSGAAFQVAIRHEEATPEQGLRVGERWLRCGTKGIDSVEFLFSANPGERVRPLAKVASGGELSRLMLALQGLLGDDDAATVIFDEVDAGIGGRTATAVAERIARVAEARQVLVVTHLAQIASVAARHFLVEKRIVDGRAEAHVRLLEGADRAVEVARMLDGSTDATTLRRAEELLRQSKGGSPKKAG